MRWHGHCCLRMLDHILVDILAVDVIWWKIVRHLQLEVWNRRRSRHAHLHVVLVNKSSLSVDWISGSRNRHILLVRRCLIVEVRGTLTIVDGRGWREERSGSRRVAGGVLGDDLLQGGGQDFPWEDFDILFNVPRLRMRKTHDDLEEFFAVSPGLGHSHGSKSFQIAPDAILLLDGETNSNQGLEKIDGIN